MCFVKCDLHGRSCRCDRVEFVRGQACKYSNGSSDIIEHNAYSAQFGLCRCEDCELYYMGDAGARHRAYVKAFSHFLQCKTDVGLLFGTLTFAPASVSPTNIRNNMTDVGKAVESDPPIGLQKAERCFNGWWQDVKNDPKYGLDWRLRKLLAVTEYGSTDNTGRLHIHFIMCVSNHTGELSMLELIQFIKNDYGTWLSDKTAKMPNRWKHGFMDLQEVEDQGAAVEYLCKYISKDIELDKSRFWAFDWDSLPVPERYFSIKDMTQIDNRLRTWRPVSREWRPHWNHL